MKRISRQAGFIVAGLALVVAPAVAWAAPPIGEPAAAGAIDDTGRSLNIQQQNGIDYVSGGVGEEQDAMQAMKGRFNLEVTMATPSGKYLGDTALSIDDQHGKKILDVRTNGPLFMAKLPPGQYVIHAITEGKEATRTVSVPSAGMQQLTLSIPEAGAPSRAGDMPEGDIPRENMPRREVPAEEPPRGQMPAD